MKVLADPGSPALSACQLALHGLVLQVECADPRLVAGLRERFANLPRGAAEQPDLVVVNDVDAPPHVRPADGRVVYASAAAEAVYSPAEDTLYAFSGEGLSLRCSAAAGRPTRS